MSDTNYNTSRSNTVNNTQVVSDVNKMFPLTVVANEFSEQYFVANCHEDLEELNAIITHNPCEEIQVGLEEDDSPIMEKLTLVEFVETLDIDNVIWGVGNNVLGAIYSLMEKQDENKELVSTRETTC